MPSSSQDRQRTAPARGFPYVANRDARLLILGSLPGVRSIQEQQYYAQPQNVFWRIMGELFGAKRELSYAQRLRKLKASKIALWDVAAAAERPGSLDSAIVHSSVQANDFAAFLETHRRIGLVCFNGAKAEALYRRLVMPILDEPFASLPMKRMPSTSPAHAAMPYAQKLEAWSAIAAYLREPR
ncbi:MAG: DNA-deoxyinosine glycosylase [Gammaproteobacteria bacterium]|nr:DNA-deoxyinosine glycosylase [Gammaproteobacteria bacterium]